VSQPDIDRVLALVAVAYAEGDLMGEFDRIGAKARDLAAALDLVRLDYSLRHGDAGE
jgi:hypothetical protein